MHWTRILSVACLIASCPALLVRGDATPASGDERAIEGQWRCVELIEDGRQMPANDKDPQFLFERGKLYFVIPDRRVDKGTFHIDAGKTPKEIDVVGAKGPDNEAVIKGIYDLNGNGLKICFAHGDTRPTQFKSDRDTTVFVLRRAEGPTSGTSRPAATQNSR